MKVVAIASVSADGKIAQSLEQSSLDWNEKADTKFFVKKTKELGAVIMGRRTFDTIGKPLKDRKLYVMTNYPESCPEQEGICFVKHSPEQMLEEIKKDGYEQVAIAGGSQIYSLFFDRGLVNEVYLTVAPVLFGQGVPFVQGFHRIDMELVEMQRLGEQSVLLHYRLSPRV